MGRRGRRSLLLAAAIIAALALPSAASARCIKITPMKSLPSTLRAAHSGITSRPFTGPQRGGVHYGRCGDMYYAIASFRDRALGYGDQPERFRHARGKPWRDLGDTGGSVCGFAAPAELARRWGFSCG